MFNNNEFFNLEFPYNMLYEIGIENPTQDQLNGVNYVISKLDDKSKEILFFRFKNKLSFHNLGNYYGVSRQAVCDKVNRILKKLSSNDYIKYGYEGYYKKLEEITLKNKENKIIEEKNKFNDMYKRVMSKQDKNKDNIEKVRKYLFDINNIPLEYKNVSMYYDEIGSKFLVRTFNCLIRAGLCCIHSYYKEKPNIYALLYHIYDNPLCLNRARNMGKVSIVDTYSTLYHFGYITEEQLLFLYLYYNLTCSGVSNFDELKSYYLNRNRS